LTIGGSREHQLDEIAKLVRAEARSALHFSHFDVAEVDDGTIAASVAGFDREEADSWMVSALREIGWGDQTIERLQQRIAPLSPCLPNEPECTWRIDHVATLPPHRGKGFARRLLDHALARGVEQGYSRAVLDMLLGNSRARALYEAAGFQTAGEFGRGPMREIFGRDALERMVRPLP
jgi:ribosomal protein S18 acetylase RimI-like enzyme